jgi:hypothetical protein
LVFKLKGLQFGKTTPPTLNHKPCGFKALSLHFTNFHSLPLM